MKSIQSLIAVAALGLSTLAAQAQTAPKILTVDLGKIFDSDYKTTEQKAKIQADAAKAQDQMAQIQKEGNALIEQYKELDEQSKNPTATAEAKATAQAAAQKKAQEIDQKRVEGQSFYQSTERTLEQRLQTFKNLLIDEISKVAVDIAKKKGATILVDKSGPTLLGVSSVLYADPSLDITDEVMAEINKDRPAGTPAPSSTATPPAASDAPKITVPDLGK